MFNLAADIYARIGGTAFDQSVLINCGYQADKKKRPVNKPAGSKLERQLKRKNRGLTCRHGLAISSDLQ
ncbi:hypothetical protein [Caballeronia zhejiangensis]|uniref:hypothetical protein n=1 Tax=Caballeronia zhejiangensis TaxID=871203 RepID=UPI001F529EC1|nr:hypothetical protein [Caballeronia zhejiangensis]MCI1046935.1 hypothetical protein [Caballeronia zhejiangensis]